MQKETENHKPTRKSNQSPVKQKNKKLVVHIHLTNINLYYIGTKHYAMYQKTEM